MWGRTIRVRRPTLAPEAVETGFHSSANDDFLSRQAGKIRRQS